MLATANSNTTHLALSLSRSVSVSLASGLVRLIYVLQVLDCTGLVNMLACTGTVWANIGFNASDRRCDAALIVSPVL
jgi:hypothetical protein